MGTTLSALAAVQAVSGDVDAGLALIAPVLRLVESDKTDVFVPGMAQALGHLHLQCSHPEQAAQWFEREAWSTDRGAQTYIAAHALPGLGEALRCLGRGEEARSVLDRAVSLGRTLDMPRILADSLEQLAHLATAGEPGRAVDLHHEALSVRAEHGLRTRYVDSLDALAALATRDERCAEAVRIAAASDQARGAMGYPRRLADQPSCDATVAELRTALGDGPFEAAWAEGAALTLDDVVAYARRSRGSRRRPPTGWASLTPTELDVVRLVVQGLSNPEIGTRLFMSRGTVKTHLAHVYGKLGITNRTELATLATARLANS